MSEAPESPPHAPPNRDVYSVSRLNNAVRVALESSFAPVWVEGELSNVARPRSGHLYFSLKDAYCQVRCAMFRMHNRHLPFAPADGLHVLVRARVGLYVERGEYQLVVESMELAGAGALWQAFEALKQRLAAEGLFEPARKRPLPAVPRQLGLLTSPTGAAIRDVLSVLRRRFPALPVLVYPVPVQGAGAAAAIARTVALADARAECDVLLIARGGGSIEDLWAFNDEGLARAIAACRIPVVTGIGHEVDFTIADFVADRRGATPSAAAELVSPDQSEWRQRLRAAEARLTGALATRVTRHRQRVEWLTRRLEHPARRVEALAQRADGLELRLKRAGQRLADRRRARLQTAQARLRRHDPALRLAALRTLAGQLGGRLGSAAAGILAAHRAKLGSARRALVAMSPQHTLDRGYAIVSDAGTGRVLRDAAPVPPGSAVRARLARGSLDCTVTAARPEAGEADA